MSKREKEIGILSPADQRRIEPPEPAAKQSKRKRKQFPPHWKVYSDLWGFRLHNHKGPRDTWYAFYSAKREDRPDTKNLVAMLAWFAARFPETEAWPVRFINGQPVECGREEIR